MAGTDYHDSSVIVYFYGEKFLNPIAEH